MRPRYPVMHEAYTGQGTADDYGNEIASWDAAVPSVIYGVNYPDSEEPRDRGPNGLVVDLILLTPKGFTAHEKDRFTLPRRGDGKYEVVGEVEDGDGNPYGWNPGGRLKVVRIHGG